MQFPSVNTGRRRFLAQSAAAGASLLIGLRIDEAGAATLVGAAAPQPGPEAVALPVPTSPVLRPDKELKLVGRALPRVDAPAKTTGRAVFGIDFAVPGMLVAAVRTAPPIGAKLVGYDAGTAPTMPGMRAVL